MVEHITKIYKTRVTLVVIGEQIPDYHLAALLHCSLSALYDTLITALEAKNEEELTPNFIISKLIDKFVKHQENNGQKLNNDSILKVKNNKKNYVINIAGIVKGLPKILMTAGT